MTIIAAGLVIIAASAAVNALTFFVVALVSGVAIGVLILVKGWWRRTYVVTILAMAAGTSQIDALVQVGGLAKVVSLGLLLIATLFTTNKHRGTWQNTPHKFTLWALWVTAVLAVTSIIWSEARTTTILQAATFTALVYILHRVSTVRWREQGTLANDIGAAYWTATSLLTFGTLMAFGGFDGAVSSFSGRHQGLFNNPNLLGMIAAITLTIGIGWATHKRSPIIFASLIIPASQVLLSESRTAIVASTVAVTWIIIRGSASRTILVGTLTLIAAVSAKVFHIDLWGDSLDRFAAREGGDLLNSRTNAWADVFKYVTENPLGVGWAATPEAISASNAAGVTSGLSSIHNSYLQVVYELGWIGAVPVIIIIALLIRVALERNIPGLTTGLVATAVAGMLIQFAESAMFGVGQPYPYLFWFAVVAATINFAPSTDPDGTDTEYSSLTQSSHLLSPHNNHRTRKFR